METAEPLSGLRVLELAHYLAGPFVGTLLAEFGAEVIKIEDPVRGDIMREIVRQVGRPEWFAVEGRGKRSLALDLRRPEGRDVLLRLVRVADVLVENFRPGTLEAWDLGPDRLWEANPSLVVVRISGFGQTGPYRDRPGYDGLALAFSGLLSLTGYPELPELPPPRPGVPLADYTAPLFAAFGTLAALRARDAHPERRGQLVDMALYEAPLRFLGYLVTACARTGDVPGREGSLSPGAVPGGCYRCRDGRFLTVRVLDERQWLSFCEAIGRQDWAQDEDLRTLQGRWRRRKEVEDGTAAWAATVESRQAEQVLLKAGVVAGRVNTIADVLDEPHVKERGNFVPIDDPQLGRILVPAPVPRLSRTPGRAARAPLLGEHTAQILREVLAFDDSQIARLARAGVVAGPGL
jgi:crotonobetainyl-CoA:carnitine CoA-transferase CaiB-like acyl-CoA transferase